MIVPAHETAAEDTAGDALNRPADDDWRPAKPKRVDRRPQDVLDLEARLEAEAESQRDGDNATAERALPGGAW